ncbi:hypothetical protein, partial [Kitasatospora sp. NPDC057541]|uniref:hypothetical protein n=1 Tax=Kitasatospora sp. NPDC057541 TaxID=3346161 RepID=UPI00369441FF
MSPHSTSARPHTAPQGANEGANDAVSAPGARPDAPSGRSDRASGGRAAPPTGLRTLVVGAGAAGVFAA